MFLPLMHLLDEGLCLFLISERQTGGAVFELERVEERAVLIVCEIIVDFLVPDDTSPSRLCSEVATSRQQSFS
jgi:hypothetical protein